MSGWRGYLCCDFRGLLVFYLFEQERKKWGGDPRCLLRDQVSNLSVLLRAQKGHSKNGGVAGKGM